MNNIIKLLRKKKNLTQKELAEKLCVTAQAVSKWERGLGLPDHLLLSELSEILDTDIKTLLSENIEKNTETSGNLKKLNFFFCPDCDNIIVSGNCVSVCCCGNMLKKLAEKKATEDEKLNVEVIDDEYYITSSHPMSRTYYISYVAFISSDTITFKKLFPEWNMEVRIPQRAHGKLLWYSTEQGLRYQYI